MNNVILLGGGGHCRSVIDVIESTDLIVKGVLDVQGKIGQIVCGYPIIGAIEEIQKFISPNHKYFISVGQIDNGGTRNRLYDMVTALELELTTIIDPSAYLSNHATLGKGSIIMKCSVINANAKIGLNSIINTGAIIEHDVNIGDHCHISTASTLNGGVSVGNNCFIGSGAVILQNVEIVSNTIIGASSLVLKSISIPGIYVGCPAKKIK